MLTLFLRAIILYAVMIAAMRLMGRRQLGQFQPYEFALTILLADLVSSPMESVSTPLLHGLIPMAALVLVHGFITWLSMKHDGVRAVISGKPVVVISKGVIDRRQLSRLCLSLSDLLEGLREAGMLDPAEVGTAVFEADGKISAFPDSLSRAPRTEELNISPGYEGLPLMLIMDGRVQPHNLARSGQDGAWLEGLLAARGLRAADVYLASLDTRGGLTLQKMDGQILKFAALEPGKAVW